jgi:ABC-type transporter Mla subunit MlaD|tara:strand:- start:20 stop:268 length:249 start_codon:yes stop_codon:yes gene_type:complete
MHIQTEVLPMTRTALRQSEHETSLARAASRTQIIDAAVGRLQVQMEEVIARQARFDRVMDELNTALRAILRDLNEIEESDDE